MKLPKGGVAFFDSGIGGLTVLAACKSLLPNSTFYYYGDNGNAPYGNLSAKKIRRLVFCAFRKIAKRRPVAAVVACNTATALCVEDLRKKFPFPVVGAEPAVRLAAIAGGEVFVLSTRATYESSRFRALCRRVEIERGVSLRAYPCDGLAGAIERGIESGERDFFDHLPKGNPSSVVLGCTHYVYIKKEIADFYGCPVFDGNEGIARRLKTELERVSYPHLKKEKSRRRGKERKNSDHSQPLSSKNRLKKEENEGVIFFLGGYKKQNKRIYEQMFGSKRGK